MQTMMVGLVAVAVMVVASVHHPHLGVSVIIAPRFLLVDSIRLFLVLLRLASQLVGVALVIAVALVLGIDCNEVLVSYLPRHPYKQSSLSLSVLVVAVVVLVVVVLVRFVVITMWQYVLLVERPWVVAVVALGMMMVTTTVVMMVCCT